MTARRALAIAAVGLIAAAMPAADAAPARAAYGVTTFSSTNSGAVAFTLARASTFHVEGGMTMPEVTIEGRGRMAGIVIAAEGATLDAGAVLYAFRYNWCWDRGCATGRDVLLPPTTYASTFHANAVRRDGVEVSTLPAGRYVAHVVADGAPVTVTVRFSGARGHGRLVPDRALRPRFTTEASTVAGNGALPARAYSAGGTDLVRGRLGVLATMNEARLRGNVSNADGTCLYHEARPPGGVFTPGCPGGTSSPVFVLNGFGNFHTGSATMDLVRGDRDGSEWTQGAWRVGVHEDEWLSPTALLWVDLL